MAKKVENKDLFASDIFDKEIEKAKQLVAELDKLEAQIIKVAKVQSDNLSKSSNNTVEGLKKTEDALKKVAKAETVKQAIDKQKLSISKRLKIANSDLVQGNVLLNEQTKIQNQQNRLNVISQNKVFGAYKQTEAALNLLIREYRDLSIQKEKGIKLTQKQTARLNNLKVAIDKEVAALKKVDAQTGRNFRNVGNYRSALGRLGGVLKRGLGLLGLTSGVLAFTSAIKDSFNRIKEFDLQIATIRGLTGDTRKEIGGLRSEIIKVASESTKTSNEVAKLAGTLITLGNTKSEVIDLLKPINDLAIGLETTSEEAADFLGQTLNAFQKTSSSGQKFADIIANVRKSTSLDFQRIKDALGFVAPTANALNLSLGRTSALIGVLQDNAIKASRAGRLLNTSFARLINKGLSLDQALEKINNSTDKVKTSSELFGDESFTLGIVLAENTEKVDELTNSFDNLSEGSLKTLTDEQLDTLAGQMKVLDSSYEKFILSVENGDGRISQAIKKTIQGFSSLFNVLTVLNETVDSFGDQSEKGETSFVKRIVGSTDDIDQVFIRLGGALGKARKKLQDIIRKQEESSFLDLLSPNGIIQKKLLDLIEGATRKRIELLEKALENPSQFVDDEDDEDVEEGLTDASVKKIHKEEISRLKELQDLLKIVNERREFTVDKTDEESKKTFNSLTNQANELKDIIKIYQDLLSGKDLNIAEIQDKQFAELNKNNEKNLQAQTDAYNKSLEDRLAQEKFQIEEFNTFIADAITNLSIIVDSIFEGRIESINNELEASQRVSDQLRDNAKSQRLNNQESIAFEQKKQAELRKEEEKQRKKQRQAQIFTTVLQSYQAAAASGSPNPINDTIRDIGILKALAQSFGGTAFDGVDDTGGRGEVDSKGGKLWTLHPNEQVWSKKDRSEVNFRSREEVKDIVKFHDSGLMNSIRLNGLEMPKDIKQSAINIDNSNIERKLDGLTSAVKQIELKSDSVDIDSLKNIIIHTKHKGNKKVRTKSKLHN